MKYIKEELEDLILNQNLSYREIGRRYNVSDTYIKKVARKLGIVLKTRSVFPKDFVPASKKLAKPKFCHYCKSKLTGSSKKYCSAKCQSKEKSEKTYQDFLLNNDKYCKSNYSPKLFKKFFLEEQNNECDICGIQALWNNKNLVFVLDHIDGNAANNKRENLRLVCPNCDSQLDTYKSKNKNSARKERYLLNYKNLKP